MVSMLKRGGKTTLAYDLEFFGIWLLQRIENQDAIFP